MIAQACNACKNKAVLVKSINTDGVIRIFFWCFSCNRNAIKPAHYLKHNLFSQDEIDNLPIKENYKEIFGNKCEVCGILGTQYHHTAPRYIFGEMADKYPGVWLCLEHHRQWHDTIDKHYGKPERKSYD